VISHLLRKSADPFQVIKKIRVDIHSHLIPGIDDGVKSLSETILLCRKFAEAGFEKVITTPHVMSDHYQVNNRLIIERGQMVKDEIKGLDIPLDFEWSAEYYADENFMNLIEENDLLPFGNGMILFEMSYLNKPNYLDELIFSIQSKGYQPVLAHPERYMYFHHNFEELSQLHQKGVLFQLNINSFGVMYSRPTMKMARKLWKQKMVDLLGTDCHNEIQWNTCIESLKSRNFLDLDKIAIKNPDL
jgi:tyrosine-protein phosphatase YwqE